MPRFSSRSQERLSTCHPELQRLMEEVVQTFDITVLEGHRSPEDQEEAYCTGKSHLRAGESKHNAYPSRAVDIAPWRPAEPHIDWEDTDLWRFMGGYVLGVAEGLGIAVRWGGDWDGDFNFQDQRLVDMPHFELL